jgi:hypothetical protein
MYSFTTVTHQVHAFCHYMFIRLMKPKYTTISTWVLVTTDID